MAGADPGMTISGLSDTGVSPGRRFQPLIFGLAVAIWALTHFTGHDSRDPSGLTLAHQPAHSSASASAGTEAMYCVTVGLPLGRCAVTSTAPLSAACQVQGAAFRLSAPHGFLGGTLITRMTLPRWYIASA